MLLSANDRAAKPLSTLLALRGLRGRVGGGELHGLDLQLAAGEALVLLGDPQAAAAILAIAGGRVRPRGGEVLMQGEDITRLAPQRRGIAAVLPAALFPHLSVAENIALPLRQRVPAHAARREALDVLLAQLDLAPLAEFPAATLTPEMALRTALGRALATAAPVLLLPDLPPGLSPDARDEFLLILRGLQRMGRSALLAHSTVAREAAMLADRLLVLHAGRIVQQGTPAQVFDMPGNIAVARLLGGMNLLPGMVRSVEDDIAEIRLDAGPVVAARLVDAPMRGRCVLAISQDRIAILPGEEADFDAHGLGVTLLDVAQQGDRQLICAALADGTQIRLRRPALAADARLRPGRTALLAWQEHHALGFAPAPA